MADCEDCTKLASASAASEPHARLKQRPGARDDQKAPTYDCLTCGAKWQRHDAKEDTQHEPPYWRRFYEEDQ